MRTRRRPLDRRAVEARLSYTALGIGAASFLMVLVATYAVVEVAPSLDVDLPQALAPSQSIVKHPALRPPAPSTSRRAEPPAL